MSAPAYPAAKSLASATVPKRRFRLARLLFLDAFRIAPGWMSLVTALLLAGSVASTCYPLGYRLLVDGALDGRYGRVLAGAVVVGGLLALGWVLQAIGATEAMALSDRLSQHRTAELMALIGGIPGLGHLERPDYLTEVEAVTNGRRQLASAPRQILTSLSSAARIVALLVLLATVSPWLLLLPVCTLPPLVAGRVARKITKKREDNMAADRRLAGLYFNLASSAPAAAEVRSYGLGGHLSAEHAALAARIDRGSRREAVLVLLVSGSGWLVYATGLMGAVAFVVVSATHDLLSLGTVLMAVSLIRRSRAQLAAVAGRAGALSSVSTLARRMLWLQDHAATEHAIAGTRQPPSRIAEGLAIRHVSFCYPGTDHPVLADVDVMLPAGATIALVGENGSGKTTLVKLLLGMYTPASGSIEIDGVPLTTLDPAAWRARSSAAFQDFSRLFLPVVEGVGVADLDRLGDEVRATAALDRAGAADLVGSLPDGLRTVVGSPSTGGVGMSGGQWQKLALGRAMRRDDPLLLVLDEPTASLDAHAENELFERYAEAARAAGKRSGTVTVLVSHRFSTVRAADLILLVADGRVVESGSHAELVAAGGRYAELFALQAAGYR